MPRRKTHKAVGTAAGAVAAIARTRPEDGPLNLLVALGGGIGGNLSSMLPDCLEPATCFGHRKFFHSVTTGLGVPKLTAHTLKQWESWWREAAVEATAKSNDLRRPASERAFFFALAIGAWIAVGLLAGLVAGYVSHLVLDAGDPSGLPLIGLPLTSLSAAA